MSKVKIELPETETKDDAQTETQDGEPKDVQDLTGFVPFSVWEIHFI